MTDEPESSPQSDQQWRNRLTDEQFSVARCGGTEPAFSGEYYDCHRPGVYRCVCCGAALFSSKTKYDSGTGWPSFYRPVDPDCVSTADDPSGGRHRIEVRCRQCGAHLGHVFDDGPPPTGLRYCTNSVCLKLDESAEP